MDNREIRLANLRYAIRFFGGVATLAEAADCSKKYLEQIVQGFQSGKDKNPRKLGDSNAKKIAKALGKEPYWMDLPHPELWDEDQQKKDGGDMHPSNVVRLKQKAVHDVLLEQYDAGGSMGHGLDLRDQPGIIQSWRVSPEWLERNVRSHSGTKNLCIVTGFGDSMQPLFNPGDPLLVDTGVMSVDFDSIYFFRIGNDGYVKRLQRIPTEDGLVIRAVSENRDAYEPFNITSKMDFQVLGRVLKVWRSHDF
jgi:phage repressor protein C with HTH and peptisase S24 domain